MDIVVNKFWFGLGVPGFSEKSSPIMEIQGTRDEEKSSLAAGSDLLILMYLGRTQPKDFQRRRIMGPKAEGSLFQIPSGVVQTVAGFGDPLSSEFSGVSLLWLVLHFSRFLLSFLVLGLGCFFVYTTCIRWVHPLFLALLNTSFCPSKRKKFNIYKQLHKLGSDQDAERKKYKK